MPTAAKVMGKQIIKRISRRVDKKLRKEQAGFRSGRGAIEQIFVLRNIGNPVEDYGFIRYSTQIGKNGSSNVQRKQMCSN